MKRNETALTEPTQSDLVALDIDIRMSSLWAELDGYVDEENLELVAALMRSAYGQGYHDCLTEPVRGALFNDNGYPIPPRKRS